MLIVETKEVPVHCFKRHKYNLPDVLNNCDNFDAVYKKRLI